jgi:hypothetical protein
MTETAGFGLRRLVAAFPFCSAATLQDVPNVLGKKSGFAANESCDKSQHSKYLTDH